MVGYADVLPDLGRPLGQLFTYRVPPLLASSISPGAQVLVPFGSRTTVGVVVALRSEADRTDLKDVEAVLEGTFRLPERTLPLATWIASYYLCQLGEAIRLFLLQGARYRIARRFRLTGQEDVNTGRTRRSHGVDVSAHRDAGPVMGALEAAGGEASLGALRRLFPADRLSRGLRLLKSRQLVAERATLQAPSARARHVRLVEVAVSAEEIERYCQKHQKQAPARTACLRTAAASDPVRPAELAARARVSPSVVRALIRDGLLRVRLSQVRRTPWPEALVSPEPPPILIGEQAEAVAAIVAAVEAAHFASFLLYGVTASGKTEVFLRAVQRVLEQGKQAIVLMPEISLTAQALGIYRARFGDRVAILHSALSAGERWDEWERIRTGEASVILGARSALFAPTAALGLIVVDEEHDTSYKQEQAPRYHAREVALKRAELVGCPVVLASATPSLESYYQAETGRHRLLRLSTRIEQRPLPEVRLVDMRGRFSRPAILSPAMRQAIASRLRAQEQVILFLNRRGYATFLLCPVCGHAVRCPDCGVAMTFHQRAREVRCHHCGMATPAPTVCARCGGFEIRFSGVGTERVERELGRVFPQARPGRLDRDSAAGKGSHLRIVGRFRAAETDILVGTQMVAKGFDFPGVTLVGVISADNSLNLPDFRAAERTFQLLTQAAGRCGRGDRPGEVLIQTYRPDHYSILAAAQQDYGAFYRQEIETRRELKYPPFSQLVSITVSSRNPDEVAKRAQALAEEIRHRAVGRPVEVLGPAPSPIPRLRGCHRWQVLVRAAPGEAQGTLMEMLSKLREWAAGTITVDVDPVSFM